MYPTIESFVADYRKESATTQKLLDNLTDASLKQEISADGHRTLGQIAWHLVPAGGILALAGLKFESPAPDSAPPAAAAEIADAFRSTRETLLAAVQTQWTDADLQTEQTMYGQTWTNGYTLLQLVKHEVHHRGQLTMLMRLAGVPVTGSYGPAKEEWALFGRPAPAY